MKFEHIESSSNETVILSNEHPGYLSMMLDDKNFEKRKIPLKAKFQEIVLPYIEEHSQVQEKSGNSELRYVLCGSVVNLLTALSSEEKVITASGKGNSIDRAEPFAIKPEVKKLLASYASIPGDIDVIPIDTEAQLGGDNENEIWQGERVVSYLVDDKELYGIHPVDNWVSIIIFRLQHGIKAGHEKEKLIKSDLALRALVQQFPLHELVQRTVERINELPKLDRDIVVAHLTQNLDSTKRFLGISEVTDTPLLESLIEKLSSALTAEAQSKQGSQR